MENEKNTQTDLQNQVNELKQKIDKILGLSEIGNEVRQELESYKKIKEGGVEIPYLEKVYDDQLFPKRDIYGPKRKPILESDIKEALEKSGSASKAAKRLGVSYPTYKKWARKYNVHKTPGWPRFDKKITRGPINPHKGKYPISDILQCKHPEFPVHRLKDKLIRSGLKQAKCEQCGYSERRITDGKIPLLLNFEDGNNKNHKLENMRLLCYNCTFTCGKGYISKGPKHWDPDLLQDGKKIQKQRF